MKVGTQLSEEFEVSVGVHQGSVLSPLLLAIVIDVVPNEVKEGTLQEISYADVFDLIADTMAELHKKFHTWKCALWSEHQKVNLVTTKVMMSKIGQINIKPSCTKDTCSICGRKAMANAVLCISCGNWIHGRNAKIKILIDGLAIDFKCRKCKGCHKNVEDQEE